MLPAAPLALALLPCPQDTPPVPGEHDEDQNHAALALRSNREWILGGNAEALRDGRSSMIGGHDADAPTPLDP